MDNIKIETERLIIRPISMFDAKDMFEYAKDPEMTKFLGWDAHEKIEDTLAILKTMVEREDNYPTFAIVLKENKKMIGTIDAIIFGKGKALKAEIGYALSREYWSKGIMTEAAIGVVGHLFTNYGVHRVQAKHDLKNPASGRVMEHIGMKKEGTLRDYLYVKGEYGTMNLYSILRDEWDVLYGDKSGK